MMKQRLYELVPGIEVWLDDGLEDISKLEKHVDAALAIVIFVSEGYFTSKNCMRELIQCVKAQAPDHRDRDRPEQGRAHAAPGQAAASAG